jgi:hypothetical protein
MKISLITFVPIAVMAMAVSAEPLTFGSGPRQVSLLELYTSEGCSSCPPAEAWLSGLKASSTLWTEVVPVAFHVDYWDYLGWRDPWAKSQYSDRQRAYAELWHAVNSYTPEFILNGREWHRGFWPGNVPISNAAHCGRLTVHSEDTQHWRLVFAPAPPQERIYEVHAALLVSGVGSEVKAGENAGRQLKHDFAALAFTELPLLSRSNVFQASFTLDGGVNQTGGRLALAAWITGREQSEVIQAVGGWLTNSAGSR